MVWQVCLQGTVCLGIKKNEIKHFLEFLFWPPVTGSERVKLMYVIVHDKYLPDNKIDTYLGFVLAQVLLCIIIHKSERTYT